MAKNQTSIELIVTDEPTIRSLLHKATSAQALSLLRATSTHRLGPEYSDRNHVAIFGADPQNCSYTGKIYCQNTARSVSFDIDESGGEEETEIEVARVIEEVAFQYITQHLGKRTMIAASEDRDLLVGTLKKLGYQHNITRL